MMDWLMHNPVADLDGPAFLKLYLPVVLFTLILVWRNARRLDPSRALEPAEVPGKFSPLEIAYLRGAEHQVLSVVLFDLHRRGFLEIENSSTGARIGRSSTHPDPRSLPSLERTLFDELKSPRPIEELPKDKELMRLVEEGSEPLAEPLLDELMLMPEPPRFQAGIIRGGAILMVLGLAGYRLALAYAKGRHNVGFLIILAILATIFIAIAGHMPRVTRRGKDYLKKLRLAVADLPSQMASSADTLASPSAVLAVSVLGAQALVGTPLEPSWKSFSCQVPAGGGCGGGGCGGGGCGGGGCGGGGCGGGGCGG